MSSALLRLFERTMISYEDDHLLLEHAPPNSVIPEHGFSQLVIFHEESTTSNTENEASDSEDGYFPEKFSEAEENLIITPKKPDSRRKKKSFRRHISQREGKCSVCLRYFLRLDRHMFLHTGEMPFFCALCNKSFRQSVHLKRHLELHRRVNTFKCEYCGKELTRKDKLKEHKLKGCKILREY